VLGLYPRATAFRSHGFIDSTQISREFARTGMLYDSNLCLYMQDGLVPLLHNSGMVRFPVFWEDDVHFLQDEFSWEVDPTLHRFLAPGLKILNFHPIHVALNTPSESFYASVKGRIHDVDAVGAAGIEELRFRGKGTRTFLVELLGRLRSMSIRFYTLADVHAMFSRRFDTKPKKESSRLDNLTASDHMRYWNLSQAERQEMVREMYNERNPSDPYTTSRDYNQRELEIFAIKQLMAGRRKIVDLGCGNGYTLISLARELHGAEMIGIDFAEKLIEGANTLLEQNRAPLQSSPRFVCADAIQFVAELPTASVDCVLTERFLLNLPSPASQRHVIAEIHRALIPGGRLIMCEGSMDGFNELNKLRAAFGLDVILENSADNLSSLRFDDGAIEQYVTKELGFILVAKHGFSLFFSITRVLHPVLVVPQQPTFNARINDLARKLQEKVPLTAGIGSNVLWVLDKPGQESFP